MFSGLSNPKVVIVVAVPAPRQATPRKNAASISVHDHSWWISGIRKLNGPSGMYGCTPPNSLFFKGNFPSLKCSGLFAVAGCSLMWVSFMVIQLLYRYYFYCIYVDISQKPAAFVTFPYKLFKKRQGYRPCLHAYNHAFNCNVILIAGVKAFLKSIKPVRKLPFLNRLPWNAMF